MTKLIARVEQGEVKGKIDKDVKGGEFVSFLGIPYAKPPIGSLRFKEPQPPESWTGVRNATETGNFCYGTDLIFAADGVNTFEGGSEDCLILNIFTHGLKSDVKALKPVMFYIHGGAFTIGSSNPLMYGPEILMTEDIVLVTFNYRTGALGFLSIDSEGVGNAGLKDMVQALKWVNANIEQFGGDPNNVTIFGESAGSASVQYLIMSPLVKGLFHKAIAQSGSTLNPWARGRKDNYIHLAQTLGCTSATDKEILQFLQDQPVEKILEGQRGLKDPLDISVVRYFAPTTEKPSSRAFLSEEPVKLIYTGKFEQVPFMTGYTTHEGLIIFMAEAIKMTAGSDEFVPHFLGYERGSKEYEEVNKRVNQFYFGRDTVDQNNLPAKIDLVTDIAIVRGVHTSAKAQAASSASPVYYYRMTAVTDLNISRRLGLTGVAHADDLTYLFKNAGTPEIVENSIEDLTMKKFLKLWTNFAKTGNPTPATDPILNVKWKPVTKDALNFLNLGTELSIGANPDAERMKFWDEILSQGPERY